MLPPNQIDSFRGSSSDSSGNSALRVYGGGGFISAETKKQGHNGAGLVGMDEDFVNDDDGVGYEYDDDEEEGEEDADDNDGEEEMVLFDEMKKWLEKKPKGFGEGNVYDTSIEDMLLEEIRLSKEAQAANLEKLKSNPVNPASKKLKCIPPSYLLLPLLRCTEQGSCSSYPNLLLFFFPPPDIVPIILFH